MTGESTARYPLAGCRVLVTRARRQAARLSRDLQQLGAAVVELPVIEIVPASPEPIDAAIRRLDAYDWIIFTSVNGVDGFFERVNALGQPPSVVQRSLVGAIGRGTAQRIRDRGVGVDFIPERFVAESVVDGLVARGIEGKRVLLPRADIARDTLPEGLRSAGARVDVVVAYRTRLPQSIDSSIIEELRRGEIDIITFASPSTVRNLAGLLGPERPDARVACIGPITAAAARESGFTVDVVADEYSIPGLVEAIVAVAGVEG